MFIKTPGHQLWMKNYLVNEKSVTAMILFAATIRNEIGIMNHAHAKIYALYIFSVYLKKWGRGGGLAI